MGKFCGGILKHDLPAKIRASPCGLDRQPERNSGTTRHDCGRPRHRDTAIDWPKAFNPTDAPVFSHNELLIHADCHRVWMRFTDVTEWPNWFVLVKDVTSDGPGKSVQRGTVLHLTIFGTPVTSRIDEFVPDSRLSWIPQALTEAKPFHYHTWHFVPESGGCRVITEESGIGPDDIKDPQTISHFMHRAHDLWLASLKWTSEE